MKSHKGKERALFPGNELSECTKGFKYMHFSQSKLLLGLSFVSGGGEKRQRPSILLGTKKLKSPKRQV